MNALQKSLLVAGVLGLGSTIASPAFAQQAYATGSSTIVLMNGASQSLGAEVAAPAFYQITGPVTVTPVVQDTLDNNNNNFNASASFLTVGGVAPIAPSATPNTVEAAVATNISAVGGTVESGVSYTRAWRSGLQ